MVRFGDRGRVQTWDLRVIYSLLYGEPKLSWRHRVMMNIWDTRESFSRKMILYVRLISEMIVQQNHLPEKSLWVNKPVDDFDFAQNKEWGKDIRAVNR
ncbi:hypothetical protein Hanom_Chr06g00503291 [Helianthus anomalus]